MNPHRTTHRLTQVLGALLLSASALAQTHKVAAPESVVRAVAIYEWTGEMAKPAASRLIPVSLFIDGKLEDADVYLARPIPLALMPGNVYELDQSGIALGTLNLAFARHLIPASDAAAPYDDGWFGYGKFFPPEQPKKSTLKGSKENISLDEYDDTPHFSARSAEPGSGEAAKPASGKPVEGDAPADDPNRPTLHRSTSTTASSGTADQPSSSDAKDPSDPDRPTLRRRSPTVAAASATPSQADEIAALNDDPARPLLHRGKPAAALSDADIPKLAGLPSDEDLHQLVAVSDAKNRSPHDFSRSWSDEAERKTILAKMQSTARMQIEAYDAANQPAPPQPAAAHSPNSKLRRATGPEIAPPPPVPAQQLSEKGFSLSYGGSPTYVYSAHTDGLGATLRYVTLVVQLDMQGEPAIAMRSVTDAAHLDRTPRMRLIDAVDGEASNRASLLFELRAQNSRQFALYRIIGARATQTFLTGSTQ
jgi:cytochrome c553